MCRRNPGHFPRSDGRILIDRALLEGNCLLWFAAKPSFFVEFKLIDCLGLARQRPWLVCYGSYAARSRGCRSRLVREYLLGNCV